EVQLVDTPKCRSVLMLGYPDVYEAARHVPEVMAAGPIGCEGMDERLFHLTEQLGLHPGAVRLMPEGNGWLLVEFGGATKDEADAKAEELMATLRKDAHCPSMKLFDDRDHEQKVWQVRESGLGATAHEPGGVNTWPGWEDSAVA